MKEGMKSIEGYTQLISEYTYAQVKAMEAENAKLKEQLQRKDNKDDTIRYCIAVLKGVLNE